jgi:hypothetical protein
MFRKIFILTIISVHFLFSTAFTNEHGSIPARLLNALRELAKTDEKLAAVLRSFSLS